MCATDRIYRGEESWVFQEDLRSPQGVEEAREDKWSAVGLGMRPRNWNKRADRSVKTTVLIHCSAYGHRVSRERQPGCLWVRQRDVVWREGWIRGSA